MKRIITTVTIIAALFLVNNNVIAQANVLNPSDPDVVFTSTNQPAVPAYGVISKWGHAATLSWNPYSYGYRSYYFKGMAFRIKFPKSYQHNVADGKTYPALFFFHGLGEKGTVYDNETHLLHGGQYHAQKVDDGTFDGFLVYPQNQSGYMQSSFPVIKDLVDSLVKYVKLDIDRINVGGLSSGGQASWDFLQTQAYAKLACSLEPISAAQYEDVSYFASHITVPILTGNGGQDVAPYPSTVTDIINSYKNLGGNISQLFFPNEGHGAWNSFWASPGYMPFLVAQHKANPLVYFQHNKFCPNETVNAKLGLQAGFYAYEWQKDGVTIPGATASDLVITTFGTYRGRFKRTATGAWSVWSPAPVVISQNQATVSPAISVSGLRTSILPAPDGSTTVPLAVPNTYASYEWRRVSDNALVSSTNTYNAPVGQYKVKVTEQYGCGSDFSTIYKVIPANGTNLPDAASSVSAVAISNNSIQLDWNDNPSPVYNETGFEIYRSLTAGSGYTLIATTGTNIVTYTDLGLSANTKYYYIIRAVNNGGAAPLSPEVSVTTQTDTNAPTAPGNLVVTGSTRSSVSLQWSESTDDVGVVKYEVYVNGVKSFVTTGTSYTVNNLTALQTYGFSVKAVDATGNASPASNLVSASAALRGLNYKYYQGTWDALPDFNALIPTALGISPNVTLTPKLQGDYFGFLWEGYINIPVSGSYTFETSSDDGSRLYINTPYSFGATPLVNNDGLHGTQSATGTITLAAGVYPIAITFFEKNGGEEMNVYWTSAAAGIARSLIPTSAFTDAIAVPANALPEKPSNLLVTAAAYNKINISWTDNSTNETGFEITRSTDRIGTYVNIGTTAANATSFVDSIGLNPQTKYWYKLKAINTYGASEAVSILQGAWGFNGNMNDGSGNNRNMTTSATYAASTVEGTQLLSFNGSSNTADMAFSSGSAFPSNAYTTRTVGIWIKPNAATLIGANKIIYDLGGADNGLSLRFNSTSLQAGIASNNVRFTAVLNSPASNANWVVNAMNHIAVVYNVNTLKLYLNGVLVATTNLSFSSVGSSTNLSRVGATNGTNAFNVTTTSYYSGLLDDLVIINEPLSAANIVSMMTQNYTAATTLALPGVPAAPSNLASPIKTTSTIALTFNDNSTNETLFEVYRSVSNNANFRLLATVTGGAGATKTFSDSSLFANTNYYYKVRAKGVGGASAFTTELLVKTLNNIPVVTDVNSFTMRYSSQKTITLSATDVDVENLGYSFVTPLPAFATFAATGNGTGTITFNPAVTDLGVYNIQAVVSDMNGGKDTTSFTLTVNNNYTPVIAAINNTTIAENSSTTLNLSATDQDGNSTLTWAISTAPSFVAITDNGNGQAVLTMTPGFQHAGVYPVSAAVSDGNGSTEYVSFTLTVSNVEPTVDRWYMNVKYTSAGAAAPWNNISGTTTTNLLNSNGAATSVGIQFLNTGFNGGNAGAVTGNDSGVYPDAVIKDYFYFGVYGAPETVDVKLTGLTAGAKYNVTAFGSSAWTGLGNNGTTVYAINSVAKPLYVDNNQQNTVTFTAIAADANGAITMNMSKASGTPYGLINAIVLEKPFDDGTTPVLPANLAAQALSNGTIRLSWKDIAYNESNYLVYRSATAAGTYTLLNPSASNANDTTYIDNTVLSATTYYYKIAATNTAGTSGYTNPVSVTTLNKAPLLPVIADTYVKATATATVNIAATDDAGDVLTTTVTGLPSFAQFLSTGNGTGTITFNPSIDQLGIYPGISVIVTDNAGASVTKVFSVTVTDNSVRSAYLNFGPEGATPQAAPWNNFLGYPFANYSYGNIKDDANVVTGFSFKLLDQWNGGLSNGLRTGDNSGVFPDNVMKTSFHTYNDGNHIIQFDGLNPAKRYSIGFLTNTNVGTATPVTFISGTQTIVMDGKYNTDVLANLNGLVPNASGSIQVTIVKTSANAILCLNGLVIREYATTDPVVRPADLFTETVLETSKIKLTWSDRSSDETGFQVLRSTSLNGTYTEVTTTAANVTSYINTGLAPNTHYYYKVRAVSGTTYSSYSNTADYITAMKIVLINQNVNGTQPAPSPWNSTSSVSTAGTNFPNLLNTELLNSGISMLITKEFNGAGYAGVNTNGIFPATVMYTNYWTDAGQTSQVKFQNLDLSKKYRIGCFGSNTNTNYATANYTCNGKTVELNSYYNDSKVVYLDGLAPNANGELVLSVSTASGSPYSFTGAYTIEYFDDSTASKPVVNTILTEAQAQNLRGNNSNGSHVLLPATTKTSAPIVKNTKANITDVNQIKVFPNPFTDRIQVELQNEKASVATVLLYDLNGKIIFRSNALTIVKGKNIVSVNLPSGSTIPSGSYVISILLDGQMSKTVKLIKVN